MATWKSHPPLSTIDCMYGGCGCAQRQAGTKTLSTKSKKNHREAIEVTQVSAWNQQVPFVISHEIIHSLDEYSGINVKIAPTVKQRKKTWQGATVSYHQYHSSGILYVSDFLCQDWLSSASTGPICIPLMSRNSLTFFGGLLPHRLYENITSICHQSGWLTIVIR